MHEVRALIKELKKNGAIVEKGSGHNKVFVEGKFVYAFPATPSCHRGMKNCVADLRRMGLLPPKQNH